MNASNSVNAGKLVNSSAISAKERSKDKDGVSTNIESPEKMLFDRQADNTKQDTIKIRRRHWESTYIAVEVNDSNKKRLSEKEVSVALNCYSKAQLPWPGQQHTYFKDEHGSLMLKKNEHYEGGISMTVCGTNVNYKTPQYVTEQIPTPEKTALHHREGFASAIKKGIEQKWRDTYPIYTYSPCQGFGMDRGHAIDFILTYPEDNHSSINPSNYTPQNFAYNRWVRMLLVQNLLEEDSGITFKEINIYGENPLQLIHKINGKYSTSKKVEKHCIDVPEGFLFIVYDSSRKVKNIYYFPNFVDYKKIGDLEDLNYVQIRDIFEVKVRTEKIFCEETDIYGVDIYDKRQSDDEINKKIKVKNSVGWRMLLGRDNIEFKQADRAKKWMPPIAKKALERTLALKQLGEAGESEYNSISKKLSLISILLPKEKSQQRPENIALALAWLKRVEEQMNAVESTLEEKLELHDNYIEIKNNYPEIYVDSSNNIELNEKILLNSILSEFEKEEWNITEDKLDIILKIVDKLTDKKLAQVYLEKAEKHISSGLKKVGTLEVQIAIEDLNSLADYYSGLYRKETDKNIRNNHLKKAHNLYEVLFTTYFEKVTWDEAGFLYAEHLKELFEESPESFDDKHMLAYGIFFEQLGLKEDASFWDSKAKELVSLKK